MQAQKSQFDRELAAKDEAIEEGRRGLVKQVSNDVIGLDLIVRVILFYYFRLMIVVV